MKKLLILVTTVLTLTSCNQEFYQVYKVDSTDLQQKENSLVCENEDVAVYYNFWSNGGDVTFLFKNKTDKELFIDMTQSFFIKNGAANDYFRNQTYTNTNYAHMSLGYSTSETYISPNGYWPNRYYLPSVASLKAKTGSALSASITTKEAEYICVPANSYKVICYYAVNPEFIMTCDRNIDHPNNTSKVKSYNSESSPLKMRNRISYTFIKGDRNTIKHIDNSFWLSEITNYSTKAAIEKREEQIGCDEFKSIHRYFKIGGPNQFYKSYR